jgi:hypothetical protein
VYFTALELARLAHLWVSRVPEHGVVLRDGARLLVGPEADDNLIATVASRCSLEVELSRSPTDDEMRARVERSGFQLVSDDGCVVHVKVMERQASA